MVANQIKVRWLWMVTLAVITLGMGRSEVIASSWGLSEVSHPSLLDKGQIVELQGNHSLYAPLVSVAREGLFVNPQNRAESIGFFQNYYNSAANIPIEWTGNHSQCHAGTTSPAFRDAIAQRINYFRAMAGVPAAIKLNEDYSAKAQQAALMMSVNRRLSHSPNADWTCYSANGAEAAGSSNLYLGVYGADAITGYIADRGGTNYPVGHRRWILYPQTRAMGSGDIPMQDGYPSANALWVFDENLFEPRPETREDYVAWPPPGYVPYQVVFPRWSFSYPDADFSVATVSMSIDGQSVGLVVQSVVNGFGENTITWEPTLPTATPPASDLRYTVTIHNAIIAGTPQNFSYEVIVINPES
jgi:uncharacterized protein YkwD